MDHIRHIAYCMAKREEEIRFEKIIDKLREDVKKNIIRMKRMVF